MLAEMYKYQQQMNGQMGQYGLQTGTGSIQYPTFGFDYGIDTNSFAMINFLVNSISNLSII